MSWFLVLLIIIIAVLIYLYVTGRMSGKTFVIIILLFIIFILLIPIIIGVGVLSMLPNICQNEKCDIVKLPIDINKIGPANGNGYLYQMTEHSAPSFATPMA